MIRFSHEANSWQVHQSSQCWKDIDYINARYLFDRGYRIVVGNKTISRYGNTTI